MNKQRLIVLIVAFMGACGTFLPWFQMGWMGVNGLDEKFIGFGLTSIALFSIAIVISLLNDRLQKLRSDKLYLIVGSSIIASLSGIFVIYDTLFKHVIGSNIPTSMLVEMFKNVGIGLYIIVAAGLLIPPIVLYFSTKKDAV